MKVNTNQFVHIGHGQGEVTHAKIQEGSMGFIMSILSNMYSDPPLAVVREYGANGVDASKKEKVNKIAMNLDKNVFYVRDYGAGMNDQQVRDTYINYGGTTKRDSNDDIGGFGIGSKVGWAYNSKSFTVTSFCGGVKSVYLMAIEKSGIGSCRLVSATPSNEQSGVLVQVPIDPNDAPKFRSRISEFASNMLLVGVEVETTEPVKKRDMIVDAFVKYGFAWPSRHYNYGASRYEEPKVPFIVLVGGIQYECPKDETINKKLKEIWDATGNTLIEGINLAVGSVEIAPSREAVIMSPLTRRGILDKLEEIEKHLATALVAEAQAKIASLSEEEMYWWWSEQSDYYIGFLSKHGVVFPEYLKQVEAFLIGYPFVSVSSNSAGVWSRDRYRHNFRKGDTVVKFTKNRYLSDRMEQMIAEKGASSGRYLLWHELSVPEPFVADPQETAQQAAARKAKHDQYERAYKGFLKLKGWVDIYDLDAIEISKANARKKNTDKIRVYHVWSKDSRGSEIGNWLTLIDRNYVYFSAFNGMVEESQHSMFNEIYDICKIAKDHKIAVPELVCVKNPEYLPDDCKWAEAGEWLTKIKEKVEQIPQSRIDEFQLRGKLKILKSEVWHFLDYEERGPIVSRIDTKIDTLKLSPTSIEEAVYLENMSSEDSTASQDVEKLNETYKNAVEQAEKERVENFKKMVDSALKV